MNLAERASYWLGALLFSVGLIWNALRVASMIPPAWEFPLASMIFLIIGVILLAVAKVYFPDYDGSARSAAAVATDTYEAWLKDTDVPGFSDLAALPPVAQEPKLKRRPVTPLEPDVEYPMNVGRMRFDIAFPQRPTKSWIGGAPRLPLDTKWPCIDDEPEAFVAQIAIADLSPMIWGGALRDVTNPDAYLVFFENSVLYVQDEGETATSPALGADHLSPKDQVSAGILADLDEDTALSAPRWFLTARDDASGVVCHTGYQPSYASFFAVHDLQDARFLPFDWATTRVLVNILQADLDRMIAGLNDGGVQNRSSDVPERRNATREMLADLNYLEGQIEGRAADHEFTDKDREWLADQLDPMTNKPWLSEAAIQNGVEPRRLLELPIFQSYLALFEFRARQIYSRSPTKIPPETRRLLERHWAAQARHERIYLGNCQDDVNLPTADPLLLMIQSPVLVSSCVGLAGRRVWSFKEEDARAARFDLAQAWDVESNANEDQARSIKTEPTE